MLASLLPAAPLHERVPTRDEEGRLLGDFLMLIPGLRETPVPDLAARLSRIEAALGRHAEVVFADLNLPLNLLWVSVRPRRGVILEVSATIRVCEPAAVLVGERRG